MRRRSCAFNATIIVLADIGTAGSPGCYGLSRSLLMVVSIMRGRACVRTMMRMMSVVVSGHLCVRVGAGFLSRSDSLTLTCHRESSLCASADASGRFRLWCAT